MLVNAQRKKLSKRRDPVAVESYRDQGYLADAFVNYLGLLGWSPPEGQEIFDVGQMLEWFRLEDVNHSPAFFDVVKLTHINGEYIRAMPTEAFIEACRPWLTGEHVPWPDSGFDEAVFAALAPVVQERVAVLSEVPAMVDFMFLDTPPIDDEAWAKAIIADDLAVTILSGAVEAYEEPRRQLDPRRPACRHAGRRRGCGPETGQGPGAHPRRRHRPPGGSAAVRGPRGTRVRADPGPAQGGHRPGPARPPVVRRPAFRPQSPVR